MSRNPGKPGRATEPSRASASAADRRPDRCPPVNSRSSTGDYGRTVPLDRPQSIGRRYRVPRLEQPPHHRGGRRRPGPERGQRPQRRTHDPVPGAGPAQPAA
ncbi:hypothetical protein [Streptomyces brasiliensis]|uniref:Uncharacterized protein n=1 Tax=Streptomyces brasiliensis TaxID=1954 RepID=A0A917NKI9_9ACTN|nr:hypothetical protein [Streptomyces brasiliensis]GGJ08076.1 hypothetical protein GCM10010121_018020 [Streptomyces brasiliensis]